MASSRTILLTIAEPGLPPAAPQRFALFELGFRPFYLLGSAFAVIAMLAWLRVLFDGAHWPGALDALAWHQHEMLFGFALAIITGFTLTAGRVWTGLETLKGTPLAMLALHWLVARLLMVTGPVPVAAIVDVAFPLVLAGVMANVMLRSGDRHNLFVCAFLVLLALADASFFLEHGGALPAVAGKSASAALYLIVMLVTLIGGRVIPSFTANAVREARISRSARMDLAAILLTFATFIASIANAVPEILVPLALAAALAQALRQRGWAPLSTVRRPILWILHLSYAWIPVGLALIAAQGMGWVSPAAPVHALAVGAMAGMIVAMVTRTALGHTGRPLRAGTPETAAYIALHLGALLRLLAAIAPNLGYASLVHAAGIAWCVAFALYFLAYAPRLVGARVDGKPG